MACSPPGNSPEELAHVMRRVLRRRRSARGGARGSASPPHRDEPTCPGHAVLGRRRNPPDRYPRKPARAAKRFFGRATTMGKAFVNGPPGAGRQRLRPHPPRAWTDRGAPRAHWARSRRPRPSQGGGRAESLDDKEPGRWAPPFAAMLPLRRVDLRTAAGPRSCNRSSQRIGAAQPKRPSDPQPTRSAAVRLASSEIREGS